MKILFKISSFTLLSLVLLSCNKEDKGNNYDLYPGVEFNDSKEFYISKKTNEPYSGATESKYKNGETYIQANFKDGQLHGKYVAYYPSGKKMGVSNYENGLKEGKSKAWHKNGEVASLLNYEDDEKNGRLEMYYANGVRSVEAYYKEGELDGSFTQWDERGNLHVIKSFDEGELEWEEYYNQADSTEVDSI